MRSDHHVRTTAMKLFGSKGKMERPEQREEMALVLRMSSDPRFQELARRAMNKIVYGQRSFAWRPQRRLPSIRVRVIDQRFEGLPPEKRDAMVEPHLEQLPERTQADIMTLFTFAPSELKQIPKTYREFLLNEEFKHPSPSML